MDYEILKQWPDRREVRSFRQLVQEAWTSERREWIMAWWRHRVRQRRIDRKLQFV